MHKRRWVKGLSGVDRAVNEIATRRGAIISRRAFLSCTTRVMFAALGVPLAAYVLPRVVPEARASKNLNSWYGQCGLAEGSNPCTADCKWDGPTQVNGFWVACCLDQSCGLYGLCTYRDRCAFSGGIVGFRTPPQGCNPPADGGKALGNWCGTDTDFREYLCTEVHCEAATHSSNTCA